MCRYYKDFYSCMMQPWLQDQHNCSSESVAVISNASLRVTTPFASKYNCSIVPTTVVNSELILILSS